jgi:ribosomal protein S21
MIKRIVQNDQSQKNWRNRRNFQKTTQKKKRKKKKAGQELSLGRELKKYSKTIFYIWAQNPKVQFAEIFHLG